MAYPVTRRPLVGAEVPPSERYDWVPESLLLYNEPGATARVLGQPAGHRPLSVRCSTLRDSWETAMSGSSSSRANMLGDRKRSATSCTVVATPAGQGMQ